MNKAQKTQEVAELEAENMRLRLVAKSCVYGYSQGGSCQLGFPGCACADDVVIGYHNGGMGIGIERRREDLIATLRTELESARAGINTPAGPARDTSALLADAMRVVNGLPLLSTKWETQQGRREAGDMIRRLCAAVQTRDDALEVAERLAARSLRESESGEKVLYEGDAKIVMAGGVVSMVLPRTLHPALEIPRETLDSVQVRVVELRAAEKPSL